jgi:hypothetical protein
LSQRATVSTSTESSTDLSASLTIQSPSALLRQALDRSVDCLILRAARNPGSFPFVIKVWQVTSQRRLTGRRAPKALIIT